MNMDKFYTLIKLYPKGIEKMWHYKSEESARAKFDKELEKMKQLFNEEEKWTLTKNKAEYTIRGNSLLPTTTYTLELYTCQFKD